MARISNLTMNFWTGQSAAWVWQSQHAFRAHPGTWLPAVNAFRCEKCIRICVDLAGVDKADIHVQAEPRRITLRGVRTPPEPIHHEARTLQILAMEIDYGPFLREIVLPVEVDVENITAEQRQGLLWIELPVIHPLQP